jgi:hypothetical protein
MGKIRLTALLIALAGCEPPSDTDATDVHWEDESPVSLVADFGFPDTLPDGYIHDTRVVSVDGGESEAFTVMVVDDAVALYVSLRSDSGRRLAVTEALSPSGDALIDLAYGDTASDLQRSSTGGLPGLRMSPNPTIATPERNTVMIPNNPNVVLEPGEYSFRVGSYDRESAGQDDDITVSIMQRTLPVSDENLIRLSLHFTGSDNLDGAAAKSSLPIASMLEHVDDVFSSIGIHVDPEVQFHDAPDSMIRTIYLGNGCATGEGVFQELKDLIPEPGHLNLVFMYEFECSDNPYGAYIRGLSTGIPGTPLSQTDAVFIGTHYMTVTGWETWPTVPAHEIGHFMGLFHTQEYSGLFSDPLDETPNGTDNVMYPSTPYPGIFSEEQAWVLQRSAWVEPL